MVHSMEQHNFDNLQNTFMKKLTKIYKEHSFILPFLYNFFHANMMVLICEMTRNIIPNLNIFIIVHNIESILSQQYIIYVSLVSL